MLAPTDDEGHSSHIPSNDPYDLHDDADDNEPLILSSPAGKLFSF